MTTATPSPGNAPGMATTRDKAPTPKPLDRFLFDELECDLADAKTLLAIAGNILAGADFVASDGTPNRELWHVAAMIRATEALVGAVSDKFSENHVAWLTFARQAQG